MWFERELSIVYDCIHLFIRVEMGAKSETADSLRTLTELVGLAAGVSGATSWVPSGGKSSEVRACLNASICE